MPTLVRWNGKEFGEEIPIGLPATIGRHPKATVPIPDTGSSRYHSKIVAAPRGFLLLDMNSRNGTLLNGRKVRKAPLAHGDVIRIGSTELLFADDRGEELVGGRIGEFRIVGRLNRFDEATEYLAEQPSLDRKVALSLLDEDLPPERLAQIVEEARRSGRVRSPVAVKVFDVVEADGRTAIVSEPPAGTSFAALPPDGRVRTPALLLAAGMRLCEAATAAHAAGVTLRGLDAGDVFVHPDGKMKVARVGVGPGRARASVISPEEQRGEPPTPASDVYTIARWIEREAEGSRSLEGRGDFLQPALAEDPAERPETPAALADVLHEATRRLSGTAPADVPEEEDDPGVGGGLRLLRGAAFTLLLGAIFLISSQVTRLILARM